MDRRATPLEVQLHPCLLVACYAPPEAYTCGAAPGERCMNRFMSGELAVGITGEIRNHTHRQRDWERLTALEQAVRKARWLQRLEGEREKAQS